MLAWPFVGNAWAIRQLQNAVARDEIAHAILITGPENIGKMTLALLLSKALLCKGKVGQRPCGECISCRKMESGNHPDFRLAETEEGKTKLSVETIRDLERYLSLTPVESAYKVALINEFEQASISA
ncbi:MAG: DNA polymerase III subunit delta', partial [Anaerolineae bacterium]|nr:DNA polymerase III subunit delta' [Anaerolineae bacterium]